MVAMLIGYFLTAVLGTLGVLALVFAVKDHDAETFWGGIIVLLLAWAAAHFAGI